MDEDANYVPLTHVDQLNAFGEAPIHLAAWKCGPNDIKWLLQNGPSLEQRGEHEMTPLHYAYLGGKAENVEVLLSAGADQTARTEYGLLPAGGSTAEGLRAEKNRYLVNGN
ncbi:ankyrin repeat domain-containing protein [Chitinolyticbacter albus]|uniref:ankyrin repeat domain-containing protein n=1 Tax=Chitinolyticbacter albus TaxID=2961951 RepID=UPI002108FAEC|nr:ankyrin repeat domain-containing protein [Chitinolyticbacter albus]